MKQWFSICRSYPAAILAVCGALFVFTLPFIFSLKIDTDLARLLPQDLPEVQAMEKLKQKIGDLGYFSIVIEGDDFDEMLAFAHAMDIKLKDSPWVRTVVYRNPVDFVKRYKYLWIEAGRLEKIGDFLERKHCEQNPFCVSLEDDEKPAGSKEIADDLDRYRSGIESYESMPQYHVSRDGKILAMRVRPSLGVTNLEDIRSMKVDLEKAVAGLRKENRYPALKRVLIGGSLENRLDEYEIVLADVVRSGWVSGGLIVLMLLVAFRNPWSVLLSLVPLLLGMALAFFITSVTIGTLNTITALLFAVIFGIGIDIGIHLISRYTSLVSSGRGSRDALRTVLSTTGRAAIVASLTTALGFFIMTASDFKGFSHLGFIAGVGILCITASYLALFPALTALADRFSIGLKPFIVLKGMRRLSLFSGKRGLLALMLTIALLVTGGLCVSLVSFNYDFESLKGSNGVTKLTREKQGKVYTKTLTPGGALFAPDEKTARAMLSNYKKRMKQPGSVIEKVVSIYSFIPADQEKRLEQLERISGYITPGVLASIEDVKLRGELEQMKQAGDLRPLAKADLPLSLREMFVMRGRGSELPLYLYGREKLTNGRAAMRFQSEVGSVTVDGRGYTPTGGALIYASVIKKVISQGPYILIASLFFIIVIVAAQFREVLAGLLALAPLFLGLAVMVIVMTAGNIQLNMYNVAILAAIAGLGVDYGIHLVAFYRHLPDGASPRERASRSLHVLFQPILFSWLTTSAGYVGLVISHHAGLRSIGILALIGLGGCFLMSVTLLPYLLSVRFSAGRMSALHHVV